MTTTFYLHAASSTQSGTLPTTKQSTKSTVVNFDTQTVNRTMDTTIGTSQLDMSITQAGSGGYYVSRFISPPLNQTSIAANTWTQGFGYYCNSLTPIYPSDGSFKMTLCVYVWRPSTGAKIGTVVDTTNSGTNHTASSTTEKTVFVTYTGSAVAGVQSGDVLAMELLVTSNANSSFVYHACIDGTTTISADNASTSSAAAFISTPENITFTSASQDCTVTTLNLQNKFITKI